MPFDVSIAVARTSGGWVATDGSLRAYGATEREAIARVLSLVAVQLCPELLPECGAAIVSAPLAVPEAPVVPLRKTA